MRYSTVIVIAATLGVVGCSKQTEGPGAPPGPAAPVAPAAPGPAPVAATPPPPAAEPSSVESSPTDPSARPEEAPLTVRVEGPTQVTAGDTVTLSIVVSRPRSGGSPAALRVELPDGITLVSGTTAETIAPTELEQRTVVVRVAKVPAEPLRAVAEIRGEHHGVRATGAYHWGREEPRLPTPPTTEIEAGGRKVKAVKLD